MTPYLCDLSTSGSLTVCLINRADGSMPVPIDEGGDVRLTTTCARAFVRGTTGLALAAMVAAMPLASATSAPKGNERAYDARLMRLSEILGAVHYLRELCDGKDGMRWRNAVNDLIKTEGNIGSCLVHMGEDKRAAKQFQRAVSDCSRAIERVRVREIVRQLPLEMQRVGPYERAVAIRPPSVMQQASGERLSSGAPAEHDDLSGQKPSRRVDVEPRVAAKPGVVEQNGFLGHPFEKRAAPDPNADLEFRCGAGRSINFLGRLRRDRRHAVLPRFKRESQPIAADYAPRRGDDDGFERRAGRDARKENPAGVGLK